jgi:hypothetical protein
MANFVWLDAKAYQAGADLTGAMNKVTARASVEEKPATTFGSAGWVERKGSLKSAEVTVAGFWDAGSAGLVDDRAFADLGNSIPFTVIPTAGTTAGDLAYLTRAVETEYSAFDQLGELIPFAVKAAGDVPLVRGQVLHPGATARTATGSGTAIQVGAVASPQRMYACLHVLSIAGTATPTLTVRLQSAPTSGFAAPTTQATFTAATVVGGQFTSVAAPVTDTWWRADWTISGTTPSFLFALAVGVSTP